MVFLKYVLIFLFSFNIHQGLQASDNINSERFELTHTLVRSEKTKDDKLFYYKLQLNKKQHLAGEKFKFFYVDGLDQISGRSIIWFDNEEKAWVYIDGKDVLLDEFEFGFCNFCDGLFVDIVIKDGEEILAKTRICPKPLECIASDGAVLKMTCYAEAQYQYRGDGFKPNEKLLLSSHSEEEEMPVTEIHATQDGSIFGIILAKVLGKPYGRASLTITRQDGTHLKLDFLWGITEEALAAKIGL